MAKKRTDRDESGEKPQRGARSDDASGKSAPRRPASGAGRSGGRPAGARGQTSGGRSPAAGARTPRGPRTERILSSTDRPRIKATHGSKSGPEARERRASEGRPDRPLRSIPLRNPAAPPKRPLPGVRRTPARAEGLNGAATPGASAQAVLQGRIPGVAKRRSVPPPAPAPSSASKELALAIAAAGLDKKALGVEVLDVTGKVDYADFLVIMTGSSDRHVHAIATGIDEALRKRKIQPLSIEGLTAATWVLIDYDDVVVHVFQEDTRRVYDIEGLWMDASRVEVSEVDGPSPTAR